MVTASKHATWRVWNINVRYHQQEDSKCLRQSQQQVSHLSASASLMLAVLPLDSCYVGLWIVRGMLLQLVSESKVAHTCCRR